MNLIIKKRFKWIGLLLGVGLSASVHAAQEGFYIGLAPGISNWNANFSNKYNRAISDPNLGAPFSYFSELDGVANKPLPNINLLLGYQQHISCQYLLGVELLGGYQGDKLSFTDQLDTALSFAPIALTELTAKTTVQPNYIVDLTIKPGVLFTNTLVGYLKAGIAYAHTKTNFSVDYNSTLSGASFSINSDQSSKSIWGYTVGLGMEKSFECSNWTLFGEYDFRQYNSTTLNTINFVETGTAAIGALPLTTNGTYNRNLNNYSNSFLVGVRYYFDGRPQTCC